MIFRYQVTDGAGEEQAGQIDAPSIDLAIASLQRRGLVILDIKPADEPGFWSKTFAFGKSVKNRDIVFLSRQITLLTFILLK